MRRADHDGGDRRGEDTVASIDTGTEDLLAEVDEGVAVLTMNRPERRNAMSLPMLDAMARVLADMEVDDDVGCIVLTGAGGAFCAGGDVKGMAASHEAGTDDELRRRRPPPAPVAAGHVREALGDAEADDRRPARRRRRRRHGPGPGLRPALRRRVGLHHHRLRQGGLRRRLRRHLVPEPPRRPGQGARALLLLRPGRRRRGPAARDRERRLPRRLVRGRRCGRGPSGWPTAPASPTGT